MSIPVFIGILTALVIIIYWFDNDDKGMFS